MGRKRKQRRQSHGSAWHWTQRDCWYYTMPGTKKRVVPFDEKGERIRGNGSKETAEVALAKERLTWPNEDAATTSFSGPWLVARVCSDYIQYCEQGSAKGTVIKSHRDHTVRWLNDPCGNCGATAVAQLKKGHVTKWIDEHDTWKSSETRRGVIGVVLAAFNRAEEMFSIPNPLKSLKKPKPKPRLSSLSPEDEQSFVRGY